MQALAMFKQYLFILILLLFPLAPSYAWNENYIVDTSSDGNPAYTPRISNYYRPNGDQVQNYTPVSDMKQYNNMPAIEGKECCETEERDYYSYSESDINLYNELTLNYLYQNNMVDYYGYETAEGTYYYYSTDEDEEDEESNKETGDKE